MIEYDFRTPWFDELVQDWGSNPLTDPLPEPIIVPVQEQAPVAELPLFLPVFDWVMSDLPDPFRPLEVRSVDDIFNSINLNSNDDIAKNFTEYDADDAYVTN